jgi:ATPase subunit of ABC transporter with duplicated ATPase domains
VPDALLQDIYERLDELDPSTFEANASKLLHGLGFDEKMMAKGTKDMSGATTTAPARLYSLLLYHYTECLSSQEECI